MKPISPDKTGVSGGHLMINEIFYSIQGEGVNVGVPMVFVRFSKCNLRCSTHNQAGFDCDTDFEGFRRCTVGGLISEIREVSGNSKWVLFTGGEPGLQMTDELVDAIHAEGWRIAVESNGTIKLPDGCDWICISPKTSEHTIRQRRCHELKLVRNGRQEVGEWSAIDADHRLVSPAFGPDGNVSPEALSWCKDFVLKNPSWRLSIQSHKLIGAR